MICEREVNGMRKIYNVNKSQNSTVISNSTNTTWHMHSIKENVASSQRNLLGEQSGLHDPFFTHSNNDVAMDLNRFKFSSAKTTVSLNKKIMETLKFLTLNRHYKIVEDFSLLNTIEMLNNSVLSLEGHTVKIEGPPMIKTVWDSIITNGTIIIEGRGFLFLDFKNSVFSHIKIEGNISTMPYWKVKSDYIDNEIELNAYCQNITNLMKDVQELSSDAQLCQNQEFRYQPLYYRKHGIESIEMQCNINQTGLVENAFNSSFINISDSATYKDCNSLCLLGKNADTVQVVDFRVSGSTELMNSEKALKGALGFCDNDDVSYERVSHSGKFIIAAENPSNFAMTGFYHPDATIQSYGIVNKGIIIVNGDVTLGPQSLDKAKPVRIGSIYANALGNAGIMQSIAPRGKAALMEENTGYTIFVSNSDSGVTNTLFPGKGTPMVERETGDSYMADKMVVFSNDKKLVKQFNQKEFDQMMAKGGLNSLIPHNAQTCYQMEKSGPFLMGQRNDKCSNARYLLSAGNQELPNYVIAALISLGGIFILLLFFAYKAYNSRQRGRIKSTETSTKSEAIPLSNSNKTTAYISSEKLSESETKQFLNLNMNELRHIDSSGSENEA